MPTKAGWIVVEVLAVLAMPVVADAQGIVGGAQQGASQGAREGGVTGGVKGALGVSDKPKKKSKTQTQN